jgi:threonine aldolase
MKHTFASDNYAGVHPEIMEALIKANAGHVGSYGDDVFTKDATKMFEKIFGTDVNVFFAYNGTGANVMGLGALVRPYHAIICSDLAHINVDESTAPERFMGCKLLTIPTRDGKIYPSEIEERIERVGDQHHAQAKVISISQPTEFATVYSVKEIKAISQVAKENDLFLHMDGSRISNAAVCLGEDFRTFTRDAGVDVLSFGGTKNGMMFGEAVVIFAPTLAKDFKFIRKQGMQLHSKMRFISAQFGALLSNNLWRRNAEHANRMAKLLEVELRQIPEATITQSVDANGVFVTLPAPIVPDLRKEHFFYIWDNKISEARLMCSFDTTEDDVAAFGKKLSSLCSAWKAGLPF